MSRFLISNRLKPLGCVSLLVLFFFVLPQSSFASPVVQDGEFAIGDIVEFKFLGNVVQGEIIGFTGTGWPTIQFDHNGRPTERFYPPSRLTLVESAEEDEPETGMDSEMRQWTNATGKFSVKAKLLSNKNGKVELEKEDGRVITLPAVQLSDEDQAFLKNLEKQNSIDNPFAGGVMKAKPNTRTNRAGRARTPTAGKLTPAITPESTSNEIVLSDKGWGVQPDAAAMVRNDSKVIGITSGFTKHKFHNRMGGTTLSADKRFVATVMSNPFENASEIIVVDLETSKANPALRIAPKEASLLAISPDGKQAVTFKKGRGRDPGSMDFWSLGETAEHDAAWNTASFFDRNGLAPVAGRFLDESRLLTYGRRVILWDCETAAALYSFAISESAQPALSANGKQIAVVSGNTVHIVDTNNGVSLGAFEPPSKSEILSFSSDGQFLAGLDKTSGAIWVWDLTSNELARQMSAPPATSKSMHWVGDKYLLVNGSNLLDVELRTTVWNYQPSGGSILSANDGRYWFVSKSKLTPISLPHRNLDAQTVKYDPDDLLVLKPGAEVSIEMNLPFPPTEQKQIRDRLAKMLEANDVSIRNGAPLRLVLSVTKGKPEKSEMSSITDPFGRRGSQTINYTPNNGKIALTRGDVTVWGKGRRFGPGGMISMRQNESAQQAANRLCQPDANFFKSIQIPKYISQFPNGKPLGESKITEQGIQ